MMLIDLLKTAPGELAHLVRKNKPKDMKGNNGGWFQLPLKRTVKLQGFVMLECWARNEVKRALHVRRDLPQNLIDILTGRRVGVPTLCKDDPTELAVGLLSPNGVSWRTKEL